MPASTAAAGGRSRAKLQGNRERAPTSPGALPDDQHPDLPARPRLRRDRGRGPWRALPEAGHEVVFATESGGAAPAADPRLLTGVIFGRLGATTAEGPFYAELLGDPTFRRPSPGSRLDPPGTTACCSPGGHAPGHAPVPLTRPSSTRGRAAHWGARAARRGDLPWGAGARPHAGPGHRRAASSPSRARPA